MEEHSAPASENFADLNQNSAAHHADKVDTAHSSESSLLLNGNHEDNNESRPQLSELDKQTPDTTTDMTTSISQDTGFSSANVSEVSSPIETKGGIDRLQNQNAESETEGEIFDSVVVEGEDDIEDDTLHNEASYENVDTAHTGEDIVSNIQTDNNDTGKPCLPADSEEFVNNVSDTRKQDITEVSGEAGEAKLELTSHTVGESVEDVAECGQFTATQHELVNSRYSGDTQDSKECVNVINGNNTADRDIYGATNTDVNNVYSKEIEVNVENVVHNETTQTTEAIPDDSDEKKEKEICDDTVENGDFIGEDVEQVRSLNTGDIIDKVNYSVTQNVEAGLASGDTAESEKTTGDRGEQLNAIDVLSDVSTEGGEDEHKVTEDGIGEQKVAEVLLEIKTAVDSEGQKFAEVLSEVKTVEAGEEKKKVADALSEVKAAEDGELQRVSEVLSKTKATDDGGEELKVAEVLSEAKAPAAASKEQKVSEVLSEVKTATEDAEEAQKISEVLLEVKTATEDAVEAQKVSEVLSEVKTATEDTVETQKVPEVLEQTADGAVNETIAEDDHKGVMDILGNGLLMKKVLIAGKGVHTRPNNGDLVTVKVDGQLPDGTHVDSEEITFSLNDGDVILAFDLAVALMEEGEKCELFTSERYAYGPLGREPDIPKDTSITYTLELVKIEPSQPIAELNYDQRLKQGEAKRERGNYLFGRTDYSGAINSYSRAVKLLDNPELNEGIDASHQSVLTESWVKCYNNLAACQLKIDAPDAAIKSCEKVLSVQDDNVKALFRLGKAYGAKGEVDEAISYLRRAIKLEPDSKLMQQEMLNLTRRKNKETATEKELYQRMLGVKPGGSTVADEKRSSNSNKLVKWTLVAGGVAAVLISVGLTWYRTS